MKPIMELRIGDRAAPENALDSQLESFIETMKSEEPYVLGFPGNLDFSYGKFGGLLDIFINNVGDPSSQEKSDVSSKAMELAVVNFMSKLANGSPSSIYGYVTSGGSEANLFGLDRARTLLPRAKIYCSDTAHYSVRKSARLMRAELIVVPSDDRGRMNTQILGELCREDTDGAIVVATIGTTMNGAIDDVQSIVDSAQNAGRVYVHLDAALDGLIAPFTSLNSSWGFAIPEVGSISTSLHKALGMPVSCAVALCRSELVESQVEGEYVGATDSTLSCSRTGMASVLAWYALALKGRNGLELDALRSIDTARYAFKKMSDLKLNPSLEEQSIIVTFDKPSEWICKKYHLATAGNQAHVVTVSHVTEIVIDELCNDIERDRSSGVFIGDADDILSRQITSWLDLYITKSHPDLGRSGAVCPFVRSAVSQESVIVRSARWIPGSGLESMKRILIEALEDFRTRNWKSSDRRLHSVMIAIPDLPEHEWHLIDDAHTEMKGYAVEDGMMIGQFHPNCNAPAAHNPDFFVNRSPIPLYVIRNMAVHDRLFLESNSEWMDSYEKVMKNSKA